MFLKSGIAVCLISFCLSAHAQNNIDVLHYNFKIGLNDQNDTITGTSTITFIAKETDTTIAFDLTGINKDGKGMKVTNVGFSSPDVSADFKQIENKVFIIPVKPLTVNDTATIVINYKGIPSDGLIISKNMYGDRTFFADNWPNRAHNWIPCKDELDDKATFEFTVIAPNEYRVVSNGKLDEVTDLPDNKKSTHWEEDVALPTKVMVIGVAKFAVKEYADSPPGIPVSAWVYPQDSVTGFQNYSVAPAILKFYSNYIGLYPYNKLANVQSKTIFGGMENASCIFYEEVSASSRQSVESLMAHEIAHQWFGDMASEKSFAHLWLSEGFATYFEHLYTESRYGTDSMNHELAVDRRNIISFTKRSNEPVVDVVANPMRLLNANSYQKGSWVLHMLRRQLGDETFHKIIRAYYEEYKGKNADTKDFERVVEQVSGKDMSVFFKQWLYTPGIPQLKITWKYNDAEKKLMMTVEQIQSQNIFQFPLTIEVKEPASVNIKNLDITQRTETFTFPVNTLPTSVIADPYTWLLYSGDVSEIK